ncbi:MAG: GDP-L-fucose synthase [Gammaproteobacteria bacterium]|nr:GDP-L-fucose synthase [Gammaproteobacteria bacterium]
MKLNDKIYVAGHAGLVGSAFVRSLQNAGYDNLLLRTHAELDLTEKTAVNELFVTEKPDYVILAAAKVGGIKANSDFPADFIDINLTIQHNIISAAHKYQVKRLCFLGSSCIYPREAEQPIKEESLLTGPLELTNRPYAVAKIAGIEQCWAYNRQYGTQYIALMPSNLYGIGDNYDLNNSHVLPALIRKVHEAKIKKMPEIIVWGSGRPKREFLYADDLAAAGIMLLNLPDDEYREIVDSNVRPPLFNVGSGEDLTILELVKTIKNVLGYSGKIVWDSSMPDGTPRKLLDISRVTSFGWKPKISLMEGIKLAYQDFLMRY